MKYACGVVLYNPSMENILRVKKIKGLFDTMLVWDNSSDNGSYIDIVNKFADEYFFDGENYGLAKSYNHFILYCTQKRIDFLCLLDQDMLLDCETVEEIENYIEKNYFEDCVIYAPRLENTSVSDWVINSNSFLNIVAVEKHQLKYDEFYFLDRLDADFCKQIKLKNLHIRIIEDVKVKHQIGNVNTGEHSVIRHYYMFRNRKYYNYKYNNKIKAIILTTCQDIRHVFMIVFFEKGKISKISQLFRATYDYYKYMLENRG